MISPTRVPLPDSFGIRREDLVQELLSEQQTLTAVDRFSSRHEDPASDLAGIAGAPGSPYTPDQARYYRDLIPLRDPLPGEQFAFEVDLDRCTGCKACVTACHSLNGLDDGETWRSVGLLQRAEPELSPVQQHVTTACHHCLEPGCAQGCPTRAYEKDPVTGIVRHLDDQCFGCQYCILKCPYDVPQYNAEKGIVRKCDMCIGRLREGEAPACAQACPTMAIRITLVETAPVRLAPEAAFDLPGTPDPTRVQPTTRYVSKRGLPPRLIPADAAQVRPEHAHLPLVFMLVASQAAAGYWMLLALSKLLNLSGAFPSPFTTAAQGARALPWPELAGVIAVQFSLALSLLHLGRPWLAWKAFLGWRRSWLSREVIAFSALAGVTMLAALVAALVSDVEWPGGLGVVPLPSALRIGNEIRTGVEIAIAVGVLLSAWAAVYASAMVYRDTPRALWATRMTLWRFALTAFVCGIPAYLLVQNAVADTASFHLLLVLPLLQFCKLLLESSVLRHRDDGNEEDFNPLWKAALLLRGHFRLQRNRRILLGITGGIALPYAIAADALPGGPFVWTAVALVLVTTGELLERFLFFTTAVATRMPGGRR